MAQGTLALKAQRPVADALRVIVETTAVAVRLAPTAPIAAPRAQRWRGWSSFLATGEQTARLGSSYNATIRMRASEATTPIAIATQMVTCRRSTVTCVSRSVHDLSSNRRAHFHSQRISSPTPSFLPCPSVAELLRIQRGLLSLLGGPNGRLLCARRGLGAGSPASLRTLQISRENQVDLGSRFDAENPPCVLPDCLVDAGGV